jgi:hypothetical protein
MNNRTTRDEASRLVAASRGVYPHGLSAHRHRRDKPGGSLRRGLAPLELALALPMLLLVMALMVNFGNYACWKVRALSIARNALWDTRWPRSGGNNPRPAYWWPVGATQGANNAGNVASVDDPRVDLPVARGPLPPSQVNSEVLDPTRGLREGTAGLTNNYAMLSRWPQYHLDAHTWMIDDRWQYHQMWRWGLHHNQGRRVPVLYVLPEAPPQLSNGYLQAIMAIIDGPFRPQLNPLNNDNDFIKYRGSAPNFYPALTQFCTLDQDVAKQSVQNLIDRIQGNSQTKPAVPSLAKTMTRAFIWLYQEVIQQYQNQINAVPPPSQSQSASLDATIQQLQPEIKVLKQFLKTLQQ